MNTKPRKSGIDIVGDIPWGTHFCHFYETKEDLFDILVPYFKTGLENNEFCLWVIFPPSSDEGTKAALRRVTPDVDQRLAAGDIEIVPHTQWYLKDGSFDLQQVMDGWQEKLSRALAKGYSGMRANGNEAWLSQEDWKNFSAYEEKLTNVIANQQMIVLCTYPLSLVRAAELFDVARTHKFAIAKRRGTWEVVESPEVKQAWAEMKRLNDELERRIVKRTEQLEAVNQRLRAESAEREKRERELERVSRALRLVSSSNATLVHLTDEATVLSEICRLAVEVGGYKMAWVGFAEQDGRKTVRPVAHAGFEEGYLESATITWAEEGATGRGPTGTAIRTGRPCVARNIPEHPDYGPWRSEAIHFGYLSSIALPLRSLGRTFGSLSIYAGEVDAFDDGEIKVLLELANDLAFGLTILRTRAERQRAEEKLRAAHEQIRALAARLAEVEEEERRRLAGELHDRVGQNLTALGINLDILQMQSPTEREAKVDEVLWDSQLLVKKAMEDIRNVMSELRPPVLDEFGLLAALRWYVGEFSKRTELTTVVEGEEMVPRLPPEMDIALFRIAQEALTNAAKHSRASRVTVTLEKAASRVILTVADDGVGFDPRAPRQKGETMGWGLILMRERAENIGGNLKIESSPGKGTRVVVAIRS